MTTGIPNFDSVGKPEAGKLSLRQFLTYENPNISHYQELIQREYSASEGLRLNDSFSDLWAPVFFNREETDDTRRFQPDSRYKKALPYLVEKLQGEVLIDLGGARNIVIPSLAKKCGVLRCIDVDVMSEGEIPIGPNFDPFTGRRQMYPDVGFLTEEELRKQMEWIIVKADMLNFIARLPSSSVNFSINGIDSNIIKTREYGDALMAEIKRTTKVGGVVFGIGSVFLPWGEGWNTNTVQAPGKIIEKIT